MILSFSHETESGIDQLSPDLSSPFPNSRKCREIRCTFPPPAAAGGASSLRWQVLRIFLQSTAFSVTPIQTSTLWFYARSQFSISLQKVVAFSLDYGTINLGYQKEYQMYIMRSR